MINGDSNDFTRNKSCQNNHIFFDGVHILVNERNNE